MPTLYITGPNDSLDQISNYYNIDNSKISLMAQTNCCSASNQLPINDLLILPGAEEDLHTPAYKSLIELRNQLSPADRQTLAQVITNQGSESFNTVSEWWASQAPYDDESKALFGSLLSAAHYRNQQMDKSLEHYNKALLEFRNANSLQRQLAKNEVAKAFKALNLQFQKDLKQFNPKQRKLNRNPLHNMQRGMNIAQSGRRAIDLNTMTEVQHLKRVIKNTNFSMRGLMLLDLGMAGYKVHETHTIGGNATRKAFEELGAILMGVAAGYGAIMLIPGVGIILGTTVFALTTLASSSAGKAIGGKIYDLVQYKTNNIRSTPHLSQSTLSIL